jgi:hypothetical protein
LENEDKLVTENKDMDVPIVEEENKDKEVEEKMRSPIVEEEEEKDDGYTKQNKILASQES